MKVGVAALLTYVIIYVLPRNLCIMEGIQPLSLTPLKEVPTTSQSAKGRPLRWCMLCNATLPNTASFHSFREGLKKAEELVDRINRVLEIDITDVAPNSFCVCAACLRKVSYLLYPIIINKTLLELLESD